MSVFPPPQFHLISVACARGGETTSVWVWVCVCVCEGEGITCLLDLPVAF